MHCGNPLDKSVADRGETTRSPLRPLSMPPFVAILILAIIGIGLWSSSQTDTGSTREAPAGVTSDFSDMEPTSEDLKTFPPLDVGSSATCSDLRSELHSGVAEAVTESQGSVDDLVSDHAELAPYAADAKAQLRASAPEARRQLDAALAENGC